MKSISDRNSKLRDPWLIQRCKAGEFGPDLRSSQYLSLDYMGAAEFEFGILPKWQHSMAEKLDRLLMKSVEHLGVMLFFLAEESQVEEYGEILKKLIEGKIQLKCGARLSEKEILYVGKKEVPMYDQPHAPWKFDVWWDLDNTLAFARNPQSLDHLKVTIRNSVHCMNNQRKK